MRFIRLVEGPHPSGFVSGERGAAAAHIGELGLEAAGRFCVRRGQPSEKSIGILCGVEWLVILRTRDGGPLFGFCSNLDDVLGRHTIPEFLQTITTPNDALNFSKLRQINLHPAGATAGDPAVVIAGQTIVEMFQFVNGMTRQGAGSPGHRSERGQRHIFVIRVIDLQLIDAWFPTAGCLDGKPDGPGIGDGERFLIALEIDRWLQRPGIDHRGRLGLFPEGIERGVERCFAFTQFSQSALRRGIDRFPQRTFAMVHTGEDRLHGVVILLQNGIELVIVAAGTPHGQADEGSAGGVDHVSQFILTLHRVEHRVAFDDVIGSRHEESGRRVCTEGIAGELLPDKPVVRLVRVECIHDPIAVVIGCLTLTIRFEAIGVRIPHHIHPMAGPAFAIAGTGQNGVHKARVGIRTWIIYKRIRFLRRGRQAVHDEIESTDQGGAVGGSGGGEGFLLQLRKHKLIHLVSHKRIPGARHLRPFHRLKGPVVRLKF